MPGEHFVSIWEKTPFDILKVVEDLEANPTLAQTIAQNAQRFAETYACEGARMLYWRRALRRYKSLFADMDEWIANFDPEKDGRAPDRS